MVRFSGSKIVKRSVSQLATVPSFFFQSVILDIVCVWLFGLAPSNKIHSWINRKLIQHLVVIVFGTRKELRARLVNLLTLLNVFN